MIQAKPRRASVSGKPRRSRIVGMFNPVTQAIAEARYDDAAKLVADMLVEADGNQVRAAKNANANDRTFRKWIAQLVERAGIDVRVLAAKRLGEAKKTPVS